MQATDGLITLGMEVVGIKVESLRKLQTAVKSMAEFSSDDKWNH